LRETSSSRPIFTVGCFYNNASYPVGVFHIGCDSTCHCSKRDGHVVCGARCEPPHHKAGGDWSADDLCVERPVDGTDGCCVVVTCAAAGVVGAVEDGLAARGPCAGVKCGPNADCRHELNLRPLSGDDGGDEASHGETICVCREGHTGDPDSDEGCLPHSESVAGSVREVVSGIAEAAFGDVASVKSSSAIPGGAGRRVIRTRLVGSASRCMGMASSLIQ